MADRPVYRQERCPICGAQGLRDGDGVVEIVANPPMPTYVTEEMHQDTCGLTYHLVVGAPGCVFCDWCGHPAVPPGVRAEARNLVEAHPNDLIVVWRECRVA